MIRLKRAYEPPSEVDGYRILVERLWPRGLAKERAGIDLWLKEISPSPGLRKWYGHDPARWEEFRRRYRDELRQNEEAVAHIRQLIQDKGNVTFVYAARDEQHNSALVLQEYFENELKNNSL